MQFAVDIGGPQPSRPESARATGDSMALSLVTM
jgi:hypothetical protein